MSFIVRQPVFKAARRPRAPWKVTRTRNRIDALSKAMGSPVSVDLLRGIQKFKSKIDPQRVYDAFLKADYSKLFEAVPWDQLDKDIDPAFDRISSGMRDSWAISLEALPPSSDPMMRFDLKNPRIRQFIASRKAYCFTNLTDSSAKNIQKWVSRSFDKALVPSQVAAGIKSQIGLLPAHAVAVENYRVGLLNGGMVQRDADALAGQYAERLLDYRANMIARTETRLATNQGQLSVWRQAADQGLVNRHSTGRRWITAGPDPCEECLDMDGRLTTLDAPWIFPDGDVCDCPPEGSHPHCFPPKSSVITTARGAIWLEDVRVGDLVLTHKGRWRRVTYVLERDWAGELVVLSFGNKTLVTTPDHPHLLNGQWIIAENAREGDKAVEIREIERVNVESGPSLAGKVAVLLGISNRLLGGAVPSAALNLNGKHRVSNGQVNIKLPGRHLWNDLKAALSKAIHKTTLKFRQLLSVFCRPCFGNQNLFRLPLSPTDGVSACDYFRSVLCSSGGITELAGFGQSPGRPAATPQPTNDRSAINIKMASDLVDRNTRIEELDYSLNGNIFSSTHGAHPIAILEISKRPFSGKVYNITVDEDESYVANGIVTHNCYCTFDIVYDLTPEDMEDE